MKVNSSFLRRHAGIERKRQRTSNSTCISDYRHVIGCEYVSMEDQEAPGSNTFKIPRLFSLSSNSNNYKPDTSQIEGNMYTLPETEALLTESYINQFEFAIETNF